MCREVPGGKAGSEPPHRKCLAGMQRAEILVKGHIFFFLQNSGNTVFIPNFMVIALLLECMRKICFYLFDEE